MAGVKIDDPAPGVRNDSSLPTDKAVDLLRARGIEIAYGDIGLAVMPEAFEHAMAWAKKLTQEERTTARASVDAALRKALPVIKTGIAAREVMNDFYHDLMLWEALKRLGD